MTTVTTREFWKRVQDELKQTAEDNGWNLGIAADRGQTFQLWTAQLFASAEESMSTDPEEALLSSHDLKADIVLEDEANERLMIVQCKYVGQDATVSEEEVSDFFDRHVHFMDSTWVRAHGSKQAVALLGDYAERLNDGWRMDFRFVTTARAPDRVRELAERKALGYDEAKLAGLGARSTTSKL